MKTVDRLLLVGGSLGLALLITFPGGAAAQTIYGVAGGLNYQGAAPGNEQYSRGFALQASIGRPVMPGVGVRLDAFANRFDDRIITVSGRLCAYGVQCNPPPTVKPAGVAGWIASGLVQLTGPHTPVIGYLIAGGGTYYLLQPSATGAVRFGVSAGAGVAVPLGARSQIFVEARYHDLVGPETQPRWLLPVTVGFRF